MQDLSNYFTDVKSGEKHKKKLWIHRDELGNDWAVKHKFFLEVRVHIIFFKFSFSSYISLAWNFSRVTTGNKPEFSLSEVQA